MAATPYSSSPGTSDTPKRERERDNTVATAIIVLIMLAALAAIAYSWYGKGYDDYNRTGTVQTAPATGGENVPAPAYNSGTGQ